MGESEQPIQVRLPDSEKDDLIYTELLVMESVGPGLWRLEESPAWSKFASWHDVVEADSADGELIVRRVVEKSGCRTIRLFVSPEFPDSEQGVVLCDRVLDAGGMWETFAQGYLIINVPAAGDDDWDALLEGALEAFERSG